ncbi:MAG TPA: hypothetical protein VIO61_10215 [Anaerolineaceae bacterium]
MILTVVIVLVGTISSYPGPELIVPVDGISVNGQIGFKFANMMQEDSIESRLSVIPEITPIYRWSGSILWLRSKNGFIEDQEYTITIDPGGSSHDGRSIKKLLRWTIKVRKGQVVYLSPADETRELWRAAPDGSNKTQITQTSSGVVDASPSVDGEWIVFSARNEAGGADIWQIDRNGKRKEILVNCGKDTCIEPNLAPDGEKLAYTRQTGSGKAIWTYLFATKETGQMFQSPPLAGMQPSWSPDGRYLAMVDPDQGVIRVYDFINRKGVEIVSNSGRPGSWGYQSDEYYYLNEETIGGVPVAVILAVNLKNQEIRRLFGEKFQGMDVNIPIVSPTGTGMIVGVRTRVGSVAQQLWLLDLVGEKNLIITNEPAYSHADYHWDSSGKQILFQRYDPSSSTNRPEVLLYNLGNQQVTVIARDATFPFWLP